MSSASIVSRSMSRSAIALSTIDAHAEHVLGALVGFVDQPADFLVDLVRDLVRVVALLADFAAQEDQLFLAAEGTGPSFSLMP